MLAHDLGKPVRYRVGVIGLERDQGGCADGEVVEIELGHILRISGIGIGDNAERTGTGHETERGKLRLATLRVVQVGGGAEEAEARLIHRRGPERFGITHYELLGSRWRLRGEAWNACAAAGQRA